MTKTPSNTTLARWRLWVFEISRRGTGRTLSPRRVAVLAVSEETAREGAGLMRDESAVLCSPSLTERLRACAGGGQEELADFYLTLGAALASGRSLRDALAMASRQASTPRMRGLAGALSCQVGRGVELADAMEQCLVSFPSAHRALVRACAHAGLKHTGSLLVRLSQRVRSDGRLGRKFRAALAYPAFLLCMSVAAAVILEVKALPPMVELFSSMGARLPLITELFYHSARYLVAHAVPLTLGLSLILSALLFHGPRLLRLCAGKAFALRLWLVGPILQARALVRSLSLFSLLKEAGVRNVDTFELSAQAADNDAVSSFFRDAYRRIAAGEGVEESFIAERHRLGDAGIRLAGKVELGMQTGDLAALLSELAAEFEERADFQTAMLPRLIEVPMLLLCALLVGSIMLAMFLPYPSLLGDIAQQMRPGS